MAKYDRNCCDFRSSIDIYYTDEQIQVDHHAEILTEKVR